VGSVQPKCQMTVLSLSDSTIASATSSRWDASTSLLNPTATLSLPARRPDRIAVLGRADRVREQLGI
jgi:hypothetical protein